VAEKFSSSKLQQTTVQIELAKKDQTHLEDYPDFYSKTLSVRLVKVTLLSGETEILCTSLLNEEPFPIFKNFTTSVGQQKKLSKC